MTPPLPFEALVTIKVHFLDVVRVNRGRGRGQPTFEQIGCVIERGARIDELLGEVNQVLV